jgi:hypothetical protein
VIASAEAADEAAFDDKLAWTARFVHDEVLPLLGMCSQGPGDFIGRPRRLLNDHGD